MKITLNNFDSNLQHTMRIHNAYNESNTQFSSTLKTLKTIFRIDKKFVNDEIANYIQNIIMKNFNIHHSQWNERDIKLDERNEQILNFMNEFDLKQHVFKKTRTYQFDIHYIYQIFDFCFITKKLTNKILNCRIRIDVKQNSNHYSISINLNFIIVDIDTRKFYRWKNAIFANIRNKFNELIDDLNAKQFNFSTKIDNAIDQLIQIIDQIIVVEIFKIDITRNFKSNFFKICKKTCAKTQRRKRFFQFAIVEFILEYLIEIAKQK